MLCIIFNIILNLISYQSKVCKDFVDNKKKEKTIFGRQKQSIEIIVSFFRFFSIRTVFLPIVWLLFNICYQCVDSLWLRLCDCECTARLFMNMKTKQKNRNKSFSTVIECMYWFVLCTACKAAPNFSTSSVD